MGLFRRRKRDRDSATSSTPGTPGRPTRLPVTDPDPLLPAVSRADAVALTRIARETFVNHGVETVDDGHGALVAMDGRLYGLTNLSATVAREPQSAWPALVEQHVSGLLGAHEVPEPLSLDEVRTQVYPRLRWAENLPDPAPNYPTSPLPGVVELAAIDYPHHVSELLSDEAVERIGGWATVREAAMTNLRALPPMHQDTINADPDRDDAAVHVLTTDDFFGPSRVLILPEVLAGIGIERPSHGVLVAVPNRHLLAVHPLAGQGVIAALQTLARISTGEHDQQPGAISRHVYFVPASGAAAQQVTSFADDGTLSINVEGPLAEAFVELGLLGG
ncbi:hypothetical protein BH09ACT12_BH09ACT12_33980 [soil metagenome]